MVFYGAHLKLSRYVLVNYISSLWDLNSGLLMSTNISSLRDFIVNLFQDKSLLDTIFKSRRDKILVEIIGPFI
jgi:hypothetical protein